ncbi:hypothetical protein [Actinoplanes sp. NPDC049802]|uniref:hypothetical protein n=1 Tax=Actinoplanes sp. NPDC049802 TaxID=3154742 RepID=UPI0033C5C6E1
MTAAVIPLWRPVDDEPLFVPELLHGPDAVGSALRDRIVGYLAQVAAARQAPLHTCTAFNALHFGYDLEYRGYRAEVLDPSLFVPLRPADTARPPLPVGTFVRIDRGGARELWAEVVARWGADSRVDADGWLPAALSGAPMPAPGGEPAVVSERVVLDMEAFGAPLTSTERAELHRLRRRGTLLDARGHLTDDITYPPGSPDARDDLAGYARHLLTVARPLLVGGPLGGLLTNPDDDRLLSAAVHQALATIADLLDHAAGLRRWQHYAVTQEPTAGHDRLSPAPEVLDDIVRDLSRTGPVPRHTAVWPLVAARIGEHHDPLELTGAATVIIHLNLAVADLATGAAPTGGTHLRIDDAWQAGGVWRSQRLPVPAEVLATNPLVPLGLGHHPAPDSGDTAPPAESEPAHGPLLPPADGRPEPAEKDEQAAEESDEPAGHDTGKDHFTDVTVADSLLVFTVALRESCWADGELPLPAAAHGVLADGTLLVELHHDGDVLDDADRLHHVQHTSDVLHGIAWPWTFYTGIKLTVAAARGARRLTVTTTLLDEPLPFGEEYRWDADTAMLAASLGLPAPARTTAAGDQPPNPDPDEPSPGTQGSRLRGVEQLDGLIITAVRRHGTTGAFGARRMTGPQLMAALFGPGLTDPPLLRHIIYTCERLAATGQLTREPGAGRADQPGGTGPDTFVWWPNDTARDQARRHTEQSPVQLLLRGAVREHWVPPFARRLPDGYRASDTARRTYAAWIRQTRGPDADTALPDGYTFVRGGPRGSLSDGSWLKLAADAVEGRTLP